MVDDADPARQSVSRETEARIQALDAELSANLPEEFAARPDFEELPFPPP
jgi:hypothetical protein